MSIEIYWKDLTVQKQAEILGICGDNCDMDINPIYIEALTQVEKIKELVTAYAHRNATRDEETILDLIQIYNEDKQFREAVTNGYELCDFDRWKHFQKVIGTEIQYSNFLQISSILWEEEIEVLELPYEEKE